MSSDTFFFNQFKSSADARLYMSVEISLPSLAAVIAPALFHHPVLLLDAEAEASCPCPVFGFFFRGGPASSCPDGRDFFTRTVAS